MKSFLPLSGLLASLALTLTSCEDVVDLNVPAGQPLLAVDGAVTDQAGPYVVRLTQTAPYFTNEAAPPVTGAVVVLSDDAGERETLRERSPGVYATTGTLRGRVDGQYTLQIETQGEQYEARTAIRRAAPLDSVGYRFEKATGISEDRYLILYYGQEPAGRGDYYRYQLFQNGKLRNQPVDLNISSDEFVDGNYLRGLELNGDPDQDTKLLSGDRVRVTVQTLTADYYNFLNEVLTQTDNGGLFATPPANVRSNVRNLNTSSTKKAVGYFAGYTVRTDSLVIR